MRTLAFIAGPLMIGVVCHIAQIIPDRGWAAFVACVLSYIIGSADRFIEYKYFSE